MEARKNLVIISESGGDKIHVFQALGAAARRRLMSVRHVSVRHARLNDMFWEINAARTEGCHCEALDRFSKPDSLVLDDILTTPAESPLNAVELFGIPEDHEGRASTLTASQLEPDQWYR